MCIYVYIYAYIYIYIYHVCSPTHAYPKYVAFVGWETWWQSVGTQGPHIFRKHQRISDGALLAGKAAREIYSRCSGEDRVEPPLWPQRNSIRITHWQSAIWRFPEMGVPLVIIHFSKIFLSKPYILGNPHVLSTIQVLYSPKNLGPWSTWSLQGLDSSQADIATASVTWGLNTWLWNLEHVIRNGDFHCRGGTSKWIKMDGFS